ncbi:MAG: hypothetical protein ACHQ5A_05910, partial [Opitutales bacterium]
GMAFARAPRSGPPAAGFHAADWFLLAAILVLPLGGAWLAGRDLSRVFRFPPPLAIPTGYLRFSWLALGGVVVALAAILAPWLGRRPRDSEPAANLAPGSGAGPRALPWWGWLALGWTGAWWWLGWTRWSWFAEVQQYTFFPLWLGFIVVLNALTRRRTGACLMLRAPRSWLLLFGLSAGFWWIFEWLNRFVENWHYLGVADFGPVAYGGNASLCFSTVLPAVAGVAEWLGSHPAWVRLVANGPRWRWLDRPRTGRALVAGGALALLLTGSHPRGAYPALWVAPLALVLGAAVWRGQPSVASEVARGDWRRAATWIVAALICGFFWELWNWRSLAQWIYTMPGVERWRVFQMPIAGYAGYLPFGLECLLVAERVPGVGSAVPLESRVAR